MLLNYDDHYEIACASYVILVLLILMFLVDLTLMLIVIVLVVLDIKLILESPIKCYTLQDYAASSRYTGSFNSRDVSS